MVACVEDKLEYSPETLVTDRPGRRQLKQSKEEMVIGRNRSDSQNILRNQLGFRGLCPEKDEGERVNSKKSLRFLASAHEWYC